ncbi:MAG: 2-oxo acid dehydrogenase subunit E2 [Bacteroidales bacterium]|nr:2-oxo acid dehydrogenase subunit E2 [Bacteroidales bacterium]
MGLEGSSSAAGLTTSLAPITTTTSTFCISAFASSPSSNPVAVNNKVEIRPMMYIALSYDHRTIDGIDSVGFLVKVKELLESPYKMLLGEKSADEVLLDL